MRRHCRWFTIAVFGTVLLVSGSQTWARDKNLSENWGSDWGDRSTSVLNLPKGFTSHQQANGTNNFKPKKELKPKRRTADFQCDDAPIAQSLTGGVGTPEFGPTGSKPNACGDESARQIMARPAIRSITVYQPQSRVHQDTTAPLNGGLSLD